MRKLLRDGIAFGFDKVLRDHHLYSTNCAADEEELFHALHALVELAALLLDLRAAPVLAQHAYRQQQQQQQQQQQGGAAEGAPPLSPLTAQLKELDGELLQLVSLVSSLFLHEVPLHQYHQTSEAPQSAEELAAATHQWAEPMTRNWDGGEAEEDEDELLEDAAREHEWLVALVNAFGNCKGFHAVWHVSGEAVAHSGCGRLCVRVSVFVCPCLHVRNGRCR